MYSNESMIIGKKIKMLRACRNISQRRFSEKIGVSQKSLCLWETGQNIIPTQYIVEICQKFEVNWNYFNPESSIHLK